MLLALTLLIATTSAGGWNSRKIPKWNPKWTPKQTYGADDTPPERDWEKVAEIHGKAILYQLEKQGNSKYKLMLQLIQKNHLLEKLQKLLWESREKNYKDIVEMLSNAFSPRITIQQAHELRTASFFSRLKFAYHVLEPQRMFWRRKSSIDFSEEILLWVLSRTIDSTIKAEIFSLAAKADLPRISEMVPKSSVVGTAALENQEECTICQGKFDPDEIDKDHAILPCGHKFHKDCLQPWVSIESKGTCPNCKALINPVPYFLKAVQANSLNSVEKMMKRMTKFDLESVDDQSSLFFSKMNALHIMASDGKDDKRMCELLLTEMKFLIEVPASFRIAPLVEVEASRLTPLMLATFKESPKIVQCLVDHGAEVKDAISFSKILQTKKSSRAQKKVYQILLKREQLNQK